MGLGVVRPQRDHASILPYRLVEIALRGQSFAEIHMCLNKVWVQRKSPAVMRDRRIEFTENVVGAANVVVKLGIGAVQRDCPSNQIDCSVISTDLTSGKTLYARNPDRLFLPASNMKLFVSALALEKLGPDYRFVTHLIRETGGNLTLLGSGDPSLSGRIYPYSRDAAPVPPLAAIEELADQAVANGLKRVDGDIVGDDRLYAWEPYPPSWTQDDAVHESGAPVSALSVADNFVTITIRPGAQPGDLASLALDPPLEAVSVMG